MTRSNCVRWLTRSQFEERWMQLLGVVNQPPPHDVWYLCVCACVCVCDDIIIMSVNYVKEIYISYPFEDVVTEGSV